jgi:hypothetical protein
MTNSVKFQYKKGQRVKLKETDRVGLIEYSSTDPTTDTPFYQVRFDDGKTERVAESDLWPA